MHPEPQVKEKVAKDLKVSYQALEKKKHPLGWLIAGMAGLFVTFPVWLFGNIFTLTFLALPEFQIRKIKDLQFQSTIRFGISLALAFIFLPVYLILCTGYIFSVVAGYCYFLNNTRGGNLCLELQQAFSQDYKRLQCKKIYQE